MRPSTLILASVMGLLTAMPALADSPYASQSGSQQQEDEDRDDDSHHDKPMTREEIRERKRELREEERELEIREREARARRVEHMMTPRAWAGVGAGIGWGSVDTPCSTFSSGECSHAGDLGTYNANFTVTGPYTALRLRGVREQDKGDNDRTPYEMAALVGPRFGHSDWYGLLGYGRILHPRDDYTKGDARGLAWEIVFAPSSYSAMGFEMSFQGNQGADVSYFSFNVGARFGMLR